MKLSPPPFTPLGSREKINSHPFRLVSFFSLWLSLVNLVLLGRIGFRIAVVLPHSLLLSKRASECQSLLCTCGEMVRGRTAMQLSRLCMRMCNWGYERGQDLGPWSASRSCPLLGAMSIWRCLEVPLGLVASLGRCCLIWYHSSCVHWSVFMGFGWFASCVGSHQLLCFNW